MWLVSMLALLSLWVGGSDAIYNDPGSAEMCRSMQPGLPNRPEQMPMPFDIVLSRSSYSPLQIIRSKYYLLCTIFTLFENQF